MPNYIHIYIYIYITLLSQSCVSSVLVSWQCWLMIVINNVGDMGRQAYISRTPFASSQYNHEAVVIMSTELMR